MTRTNPEPKKRPYRRAAMFPARINVSLPQEIVDQIERDAQDKDISLSQALREQIMDWWAQEKVQERDAQVSA